MKRLILIFLSFFILTGCTISIGEDDKEREKDVDNGSIEVEEKDEQEKVLSIGKESNLSNPLSVGEYGLASKYNAVISDYKNVDVTLKEVFTNSNEIVEQYNIDNPDNIIEKKDGFRYVVLEYEVIFFDFETESFGEDVILDMEVLNLDGSCFVVNDVKQVINSYVLTNDTGIVNGEKGTVKVAFLIPSTAANFLVKFGTSEQTIAYYKV